MKTFEEIKEDSKEFIDWLGWAYLDFQNNGKDFRDAATEEIESRLEPMFNDFALKYDSLLDRYADLRKKHEQLLKTSIQELQEQYFEHEKQ